MHVPDSTQTQWFNMAILGGLQLKMDVTKQNINNKEAAHLLAPTLKTYQNRHTCACAWQYANTVV